MRNVVAVNINKRKTENLLMPIPILFVAAFPLGRGKGSASFWDRFLAASPMACARCTAKASSRIPNGIAAQLWHVESEKSLAQPHAQKGAGIRAIYPRIKTWAVARRELRCWPRNGQGVDDSENPVIEIVPRRQLVTLGISYNARQHRCPARAVRVVIHGWTMAVRRIVWGAVIVPRALTTGRMVGGVDIRAATLPGME